MTRLFWIILAIIMLGAAAFVSMTSFGTADRTGSIVADVPAVEAGAANAIVVPVAGVSRDALRDSWGDPRGNGKRGHHGTDIMAPGGTPVVAAAAGTVEKLFESRLGGTTIYVRSPDRRWIYYYAHLSGYAPGLQEGQRVAAGERIAFVGDTGDAGAGNYHLHFGMQRMQPGERWYQGQDVDPYPLLAAKPGAR